jgi:HD-GYP domain-containing protein (c-di-GMP phosphodiesterase class II)
MPVFELPPDVLRVGEPILFALRDKTGCLLVPRGTLVASEEQRQQLTARHLYVDEQDSVALKRAIAGKVHSMVWQNALLGRIAQARPDASDTAAAGERPTRRLADAVSAWGSLQMRLSAVLRDTMHADFATRLLQLQRHLLDTLDSDADDALLLLVHSATQELHDYSVRHALLVAVICELAARHLPGWNDESRRALRCAALTMNVSMTSLQDQLALQELPIAPEQVAQVAGHAGRSADLLRRAGVVDALWLDAVAHHHDAPAGPLNGLAPGLRLARLLRRADVFAARMSPRRTRPAMSATAAAKAAYLDEHQRPDEAGSAILKATGLYPPGCMVRLRNGEVAVVLRRGAQANAPVVAAIVNAEGNPIAEPATRNVTQPAHAVTGGVAAHEVKVRLNVPRLLAMT